MGISIGKIIRFCALFTMLILLSGCATGQAPMVSVAEKSKQVASLKKIDEVRVVWINKPFKFLEPKVGVKYRFDFGLSMGLAGIPDELQKNTYSQDEVSSIFYALGNLSTKKLQERMIENNIINGGKYILELTPRKAYIKAKNMDDDIKAPISGNFMIMVSLKKADDMSELWFMKAYVRARSDNSNEISTNEFALTILDNMRIDGLL